jgi:hypothetical protein
MIARPGQLSTDQFGVEADPTGHAGTSPKAARNS